MNEKELLQRIEDLENRLIAKDKKIEILTKDNERLIEDNKYFLERNQKLRDFILTNQKTLNDFVKGVIKWKIYSFIAIKAE